MEAAKTGGSKQHHPSTPAVSTATPAPPPSTRRPRVREVSSRFMSPVSSSSSSSSSAGDLHLFTSSSLKLNQTQRPVSALRHIRQLRMADGGDENRSSETTARSLDSPFTLLSKTSKHIQPKPFKENSHRLDTPTQILPQPSRSRLSQQRLLTASAATRLLQLSVTSASREKEGINELPTLSCRTHSKLFNSSGPSPLKPSLSSPLSSCNGCDSNSFSRSIRLSILPPVPPNSKIPADTKKQRKFSEQLEEMHSMKLLHNRYLQWRFVNANAQMKTQAQKAQTETKFCSFGLKISELRDSVERKRIELQRLSKVRDLLAIIESQTPHLEQWSAIEEEYSDSLSQTIQALSIASLRLPLDSDIMVENKELGEALVIASKVMDGVTQNVGNYMSKVQEVENLVSELARVSRGERSLTEDCGFALLKTQAFNIEECSLMSQLIQHQTKRHVTEHNSCYGVENDH